MRRILLATAASLALAACGGADADADGDGSVSMDEAQAELERSGAVKPEPGQYRARMELVDFEAEGAPPQIVEMMKSNMANTFEYCLTQEDADKGFEEMARTSQDDNCSFEKFEADGGDIDAVMTCQGGEMGNARMTMQGTGGRTQSEMTMTMEGQLPGAGTGKMTMKTSHERIGDCPAEG